MKVVAATSSVIDVDAVVVAATSSVIDVDVTPAPQVINMMTELQATGEKKMEENRKRRRWRSSELARGNHACLEIQDSVAAVAQTEELIAFNAMAESETVPGEVKPLQEEIAKLDGEKKAATEERATQCAEYLKPSKDYSGSSDASQRANQVMSTENFTTDQPSEQIQLMRLLAGEIKHLQEEIAKLDGEKKAATEEGATQCAEYLKISKDYSGSSDALQRANQLMSTDNFKTDQPSEQIQLHDGRRSPPPTTSSSPEAPCAKSSASVPAVAACERCEFQSEGIAAYDFYGRRMYGTHPLPIDWEYWEPANLKPLVYWPPGANTWLVATRLPVSPDTCEYRDRAAHARPLPLDEARLPSKRRRS